MTIIARNPPFSLYWNLLGENAQKKITLELLRMGVDCGAFEIPSDVMLHAVSAGTRIDLFRKWMADMKVDTKADPQSTIMELIGYQDSSNSWYKRLSSVASFVSENGVNKQEILFQLIVPKAEQAWKNTESALEMFKIISVSLSVVEYKELLIHLIEPFEEKMQRSSLDLFCMIKNDENMRKISWSLKESWTALENWTARHRVEALASWNYNIEGVVHTFAALLTGVKLTYSRHPHWVMDFDSLHSRVIALYGTKKPHENEKIVSDLIRKHHPELP